jgi:hypothetical protein
MDNVQKVNDCFLAILYFTVVISYIKAKLCVVELRATCAEKLGFCLLCNPKVSRGGKNVCPAMHPSGTRNAALKIGTVPP